jgi:1,4-alpha-glucan branching enzyme
MSTTIGSFCLVLHGHIPYVLRHGIWPHGEDWLYEAAAETYLPLISVIDECRYLNGLPRVTVGLMPILLEQLAHDDFRRGFERYLDDRVERAVSDRMDFERRGESHLAELAARWEQFYLDRASQFGEMDRNIPGAFRQRAAEGQVQILTSAATHSYIPLLLEDSSICAQVRAGMSSSRRILGFDPKGMWLPEGAYRPGGRWKPAVAWDCADSRVGIERLIANEGITHFFVENHVMENGRNSSGRDVQGSPAARSVHEPVFVDGDHLDGARIAAFARDAHICKQVWCGYVGYPADGVYLEFHKRQGQRRGLRYWKVTDRKSGLGEKAPYCPDDVPGKLHEHVQHFCREVKRRLYEHYQRSGRPGAVVACFDAELFGHWWFEGPRFLRDVMLTLNAEPDVELCTVEEYLQTYPPETTVALPEGSWGEGGDHRVWANANVSWIWQQEYRCESLFGKLTYHLPWRQNRELREILQKAGRELLLLQASDWPFVISRDQATDYGIKRFVLHCARFERLADIAERLADDPEYLRKLSEIEKFELRDAEIHDVVFADIDLNWWNT